LSLCSFKIDRIDKLKFSRTDFISSLRLDGWRLHNSKGYIASSKLISMIFLISLIVCLLRKLIILWHLVWIWMCFYMFKEQPLIPTTLISGLSGKLKSNILLYMRIGCTIYILVGSLSMWGLALYVFFSPLICTLHNTYLCI